MEPASRKVGEPDELLGVVFSLEEVRGVCDEVLKIAGAHIAEVRVRVSSANGLSSSLLHRTELAGLDALARL